MTNFLDNQHHAVAKAGLPRMRAFKTWMAGDEPGHDEHISRIIWSRLLQRFTGKDQGADEPYDLQRHLRKRLSGTLGYLAEIRWRIPESLSDSTGTISG